MLQIAGKGRNSKEVVKIDREKTVYQSAKSANAHSLKIKGHMHHKYDVSSKDSFYLIDMAARIFNKYDVLLDVYSNLCGHGNLNGKQ